MEDQEEAATSTASGSGDNSGKFDGTMLKFLTHKLRSHSLNEEVNQEKVSFITFYYLVFKKIILYLTFLSLLNFVFFFNFLSYWR